MFFLFLFLPETSSPYDQSLKINLPQELWRRSECKDLKSRKYSRWRRISMRSECMIVFVWFAINLSPIIQSMACCCRLSNVKIKKFFRKSRLHKMRQNYCSSFPDHKWNAMAFHHRWFIVKPDWRFGNWWSSSLWWLVMLPRRGKTRVSRSW